jgi:hypothetical protein
MVEEASKSPDSVQRLCCPLPSPFHPPPFRLNRAYRLRTALRTPANDENESSLFGFLLGSTLAGAAVYYYILEEYKLSNEMLTEDIYVCMHAFYLSTYLPTWLLACLPNGCGSHHYRAQTHFLSLSYTNTHTHTQTLSLTPIFPATHAHPHPPLSLHDPQNIRRTKTPFPNEPCQMQHRIQHSLLLVDLSDTHTHRPSKQPPNASTRTCRRLRIKCLCWRGRSKKRWMVDGG